MTDRASDFKKFIVKGVFELLILAFAFYLFLALAFALAVTLGNRAFEIPYFADIIYLTGELIIIAAIIHIAGLFFRMVHRILKLIGIY